MGGADGHHPAARAEKTNTGSVRRPAGQLHRQPSGSASRAARYKSRLAPAASGRIQRQQNHFLDLAGQLRNGMLRSAENLPCTHVVHIGAGGSRNGMILVDRALQNESTRRSVFFPDPATDDLSRLLPGLDPQRTFFIIASKSFRTPEVLAAARQAGDWLQQQGGRRAQRQMMAVSADRKGMHEFGITGNRQILIDRAIGGRYSLWSGMSLAIAWRHGTASFRHLLAGARAMDQHFAATAFHKNLPVLAALADIWNRNFLHLPQRILLSYDHRLDGLMPYLMQLEMESLGKRTGRDGSVLPYHTGAAVWGDLGQRARHSFYQLLHQGNADYAAELITVAAGNRSGNSATNTVSSISGQLAHGRRSATAHHRYPGRRPHRITSLSVLSSRTLGLLLAFYEHKVYAQAALWGINPFDQPAVEHSRCR